MSTFSSQSRRSGFSLIEIAIALAIFVFGALAIVQIFPPALGVIRNNENRATATQLGATMLARSTEKVASVPDAIYESDATGTWLSTSDIPYAVVGTPSKNASLPRGPLPTDFDNSALSRFRYVKGEKHILRLGNTTQPFLMLNYPYANDVRFFQEVRIEGVQIDGRGVLDFTYATNPDGTQFIPLTGVTADSPTYYVSYRWNEGGNITGVIDEPLKLLGSGTGDDQKVAQGLINTTNRVLAGNVAIYYRQYIDTKNFVTDDANRGLVVLPSSFSYLVGKTLSFDYQVADWRNIVDENSPDKAGIVSLPIRNLSQDAKGVLTFTNANTLSFINAPATISDLKKGQVTYASAVGKIAPRIRTIYQPLDGWAQQVSVAAKAYVPAYANADFAFASLPGTRPTTIPREQWREYYWSNTNAGTLYFHASEIGKSVSVSFIDDTTGQIINNAILTIDDDLVPTSPNSNFSTSSVAAARLINIAGVEVNARSILSIKGLSIQARTAWQNGDRYNQVIVPGYRTLMP